jgi:protein-tyrosine phosphatase
VISERMTAVYRELPYEDGHIEVFGKAFAALPVVEGPVVLHCHAGKDRTGLIVAFIQHALGVAHDDILSDYLATNTKSRIEERLPGFVKTFRETHGVDAPPNLLRHIWRVEKGYLDAALDEITARDGSLDGYLERRLGVTPALKAAIRNRLLASDA